MNTAVALLDQRVITVPGSAFGSEGEGFLRLSFSIDAALIEEGIRRIGKGLGKVRTTATVAAVNLETRRQTMKNKRTIAALLVILTFVGAPNAAEGA